MKAYIPAILAAITWGLAYTLDQRALTKLSPLAVVFLCSAVSTVLLIPFVDFGEFKRVDAVTMKWALGGAVFFLLGNTLILFGIKGTSASAASLIEISYPFFVILFSYLIFGQQLSVKELIGGAIAFFGVALIVL